MPILSLPQCNRYSGYDVRTNGALFGVAWEPSTAFALGGYAGFSGSKTNFNDLSADTKTVSTHAGVQATYLTPFGLRITADGSYSHNSIDMKRYPGNLGKNTSYFTQKVTGAGLEFAYEIPLSETTRLTPEASLEAAWLWQDSFKEKGRVLAACVDKMQSNRVTSYLGAELEHDFIFDQGTVTPGLGLTWKHQYTGLQKSVDYGFVDNVCSGSYPCEAKSRELGADAMEASAFIEGKITTESADYSVRAGYTLDVGKDSLGHLFYGGVAVSF